MRQPRFPGLESMLSDAGAAMETKPDGPLTVRLHGEPQPVVADKPAHDISPATSTTAPVTVASVLPNMLGQGSVAPTWRSRSAVPRR